MPKSIRSLTEEQIAQAISLYESGKTLREVAVPLDIYPQSFWLLLQKRGVEIRSIGTSNRLGPVNEHVFKSINERSAWVVGMLIADGCVTENEDGCPSIMIGLQERDLFAVAAIRNLIAPDYPLIRRASNKPNQQATISFRIRSRILADDLHALGVTCRKSLTAKASDKLINDRNFWRGCVEGDGSVIRSKDGRYYVMLCGSGALMNQFADYCTTVIPNFRPVLTPNRNIFKVHISGRKAVMLMRSLYHNATVGMERKWAVARLAMDEYDVKEHSERSLVYTPHQIVPQEKKPKTHTPYIAPPETVTYKGETLPLDEMAAKYRMTRICLGKRLANGMAAEEAIETPLNKRGGKTSLQTITFRGETNTIKHFALKFGQNPPTVYARLEKLWSYEQAFGLDPKPLRTAWNKKTPPTPSVAQIQPS